MPHAWTDIVAHYRCELDANPSGDGFKLAVASVGALAEQIEQAGLGHRLFGWTSMHDLCIQQLNRPPYTCAYLRIAPLTSGEVEFRYVDTPTEALQWRRKVPAQDTTQRFISFLNQLKWVDRESADCLGAPISQDR